jgi:hypothetical protein
MAIKINGIESEYTILHNGVQLQRALHNGVTEVWTAYAKGTVTSFDFTGTIQEFVVPASGTYKLEVWGGQGQTVKHTAGSSTSTGSGGKGGYAYGNIMLNAGQTIYVVVGGGSGKTYNGGGSGKSSTSGWTEKAGSGGGATHIGTFNDTLASHGSTSGLFIVAGGAGGGTAHGESDWVGTGKSGGTGGGISGGKGAGNTKSEASQTSGYSFGKGRNAAVGTYGANGAGGGGLYGGNIQDNAGNYDAHYGGNGGSGYIGGVTNGATENGVQSGNGKATITYLGKL